MLLRERYFCHQTQTFLFNSSYWLNESKMKAFWYSRPGIKIVDTSRLKQLDFWLINAFKVHLQLPLYRRYRGHKQKNFVEKNNKRQVAAINNMKYYIGVIFFFFNFFDLGRSVEEVSCKCQPNSSEECGIKQRKANKGVKKGWKIDNFERTFLWMALNFNLHFLYLCYLC